MLDIQRIRKETEQVVAGLAKRGVVVDFTEFLEKDEKRRQMIADTEALKAKRNKTSAEIPKLKKAGEDVSSVIQEMKALSDEIKEADAALAALQEEQDAFLAGLPNVPAEDVVAGGKENNEVIRVVGEKPAFDFKPRHHVDLAEQLGLIDYARGAKLSGNGYWIYTNLGAQLEWALLNYFIETHLQDGYEMMLVPHSLNYACGFAAGQFPKFADEVYWLDAGPGEERKSSHFLLPTAETALVNLHRDEILTETELPKKYFAYTPCYRKEAGSYRAEERGMIRGHQFNKVELFQYALPEQSEAAFTEL
ncbi:MAG TPA: serine--tRNA ligase, partial [Clostridiaceae bacterium]|nr:serine--tRNA ligase [Clostridiaceae bacterium]